MSATSIMVFGEIEVSTNRALAYAILASQAARGYIMAIVRMREVTKAVEQLIQALSPERLDGLSAEHKEWLKARLQEIHKHLAAFSRSNDVVAMSGLNLPVLSGLLARLQDDTEDLDDVIEDLVLVSDAEFRNLIATCSTNIGLPIGESFARSYPHINDDLKDAFSEIEKNILANRARRTLGGTRLDLYKYRQNSKDLKRGARYGWRIYCLHDKQTGIMYPIIVYPKTAWEDADNKTVKDAISTIKSILGHCIQSECDGAMIPVQPEEVVQTAGTPEIKVRCEKCKAIAWREHLIA
jgi:hypothetical protein